MEKMLYIRLRHRIQAKPNQRITIGDVAQLVASDAVVQRISKIAVHQVNMSDKSIVIVDVMQVIKELQKVDPTLEVQTFGPVQTIIEVVYKQKRFRPMFFAGVWLLLFFGAALAIMNFHEDVSMRIVHQKIFKTITGLEDEKPLLLQIPYSIGLGLGMILFFNHVFRKRINEEPSPLEVEMFNYQQDLDRYVVMNENKESTKKIDDH
ncbi:stage V sporulation protein AA [Sutcliffiella deserti]|uniref:stage V sporulation protein AA n=1 Tax=Sutcliffiella deserti TaxID=2875501 RepID=UPI001CBFCF02|nr:stage V sporulation protein AA [Sutcliffiella deserti]